MEMMVPGRKGTGEGAGVAGGEEEAVMPRVSIPFGLSGASRPAAGALDWSDAIKAAGAMTATIIFMVFGAGGFIAFNPCNQGQWWAAPLRAEAW